MTVLDRLDATIRLSDTEAMLLDSVRRLGRDVLKPNAARLDETAEFPWDNLKAINQLGLNAMFIPEEYGGAPVSFTAYLACNREIAKACAATGIVWSTIFHAASPVVDYATHEQKKRWLPGIAEGGLCALALTEPSGGSDATAMKTRFQPDGDDVIINGSKIFITNGDVCDFVVVFGKWAPLGDGKDAISLAVVEKGTPGFEVLRLENKMGMRASSTAAIAFENCRIPRANLLGEPGQGLELLFGFLGKSRPSVACHALGIARAAFEDAVEYLNERRQFKRRLIEFQGNQFILADLGTDLAMCESWMWQLARRIEDGEKGLNLEASMLKMRASDLAMRISTQAVQFHGGYGYMKDLRVERLMRDAKLTQIWEGANELQRQLIGRGFMGPAA
jgi:acyl-CoA dehydrogenase